MWQTWAIWQLMNLRKSVLYPDEPPPRRKDLDDLIWSWVIRGGWLLFSCIPAGLIYGGWAMTLLWNMWGGGDLNGELFYGATALFAFLLGGLTILTAYAQMRRTWHKTRKLSESLHIWRVGTMIYQHPKWIRFLHWRFRDSMFILLIFSVVVLWFLELSVYALILYIQSVQGLVVAYLLMVGHIKGIKWRGLIELSLIYTLIYGIVMVILPIIYLDNAIYYPLNISRALQLLALFLMNEALIRWMVSQLTQANNQQPSEEK
jgi:hypothetical protein